MEWFIADRPTPVLNTANFGLVFHKTLPLNESGHPYHYEFIALPQMVFPIVKQISEWIFQIKWADYGSTHLYIDSRFGTISKQAPKPAPLKLPSREIILENMEQWIGAPYVWGGNWAAGIPELLTFYPPQTTLDERTKTLWTFRGLDCSGLLFQATNGVTPRNSSQLVNYGKAIQLKELGNPVDMIVYPGHVLFLRDPKTIIESKSPFGVRVCRLEDRLNELLAERNLVKEWTSDTDFQRSFILRRFC